MADLLAAATKQIEYAGNEFQSGDKAKGQEHLDKAASFIQRAAGSTAAAPAADTAEPLSRNPNIATAQILAATGVEPHVAEDGGISYDPNAVLAAATPDQNKQLALLGVFGQKGQHAEADYSEWEKYYEQRGGNWVRKGEPRENDPQGDGEGFEEGDTLSHKGQWESYLDEQA